MTDFNSPRLLADIGGTNARFAWQARPGAEIGLQHTLLCAEHSSIADAINHYLDLIDRTAPPSGSIAIANPVVGDHVAMTNHHWTFSISDLRRRVGFGRLLVVNDFTALALALPSLQRNELRQVGGRRERSGCAVALIGAGTGLGVSGLLPDGRGGWSAIQGEGGHVTLAGTTPREKAVLDWIERRYGHASAERVVCGQGLVDIHHALSTFDAPCATVCTFSAAEISRAAVSATDLRCVESAELFCAFLGTAAGNLALTLGARGGVYIGGGIVPCLGEWFDTSPFRARFESKGRFEQYLAEIPVFVIGAHGSPALTGAACALDAGTSFAGWAA